MNSMAQGRKGRRRLVMHFTWLTVAAGAAACLLAAYRLPVHTLDARFLLLSLSTIALGPRLSIQIPRAKVRILASDTFIFLALLLYGAEAAVLLAAAEALATSLTLRQKGVTIRADGVAFNAALMACSTLITAWVLGLSFGPVVELSSGASTNNFIVALCFMALVQYTVNSGLAAVYTACETDRPVWSTWNENYFCTSITYFVGAAAAGTLIRLVGEFDLLAIAVTTSVVSLIYLTHRRYIDDVSASAAQAEQAERARAEAEHARAEQAERHVKELNYYIEELEWTGKELRESKEHFRHLAFHDVLTGLPNRTLFTDHLRLAIERARHFPEYQFAVLFLDLDRFKNINDSLGHTHGDQLLIAVAHRLQQCLRQGDTVARLGGDEFAVLLDGIEEYGEAVRVAEEIQRILIVPVHLDKHETFTTASIGIALSTTGYERPEDVLRDADTAMYRAKDSGKARHEVFDKVMHAHAVSRLRLEYDLRRALKHGEFFNYYQPIVSLATGALTGFEALVRWRHPERGLVSPAEFIPMAEETGLIVPLGLHILEEACRQLREWQRCSPANRGVTMSVNLSGKQLAQPDLIEQVERILNRTEIDPSCLKLEITESVVMENAEHAAVMFERLRAFGLQLSIDDFGTGYSSLSYLHSFPVSTLKIDRSFITKMTRDRENLEIVRTIVTLARNLGLSIVAEGVETDEQCRLLRSLRCDYGQGYLFSRPLDAAEAEALLRERRQWRAGAAFLPEADQQQGVEQIESALLM